VLRLWIVLVDQSVRPYCPVSVSVAKTCDNSRSWVSRVRVNAIFETPQAGRPIRLGGASWAVLALAVPGARGKSNWYAVRLQANDTARWTQVYVLRSFISSPPSCYVSFLLLPHSAFHDTVDTDTYTSNIDSSNHVPITRRLAAAR
jgi:hypothetical protein